MSLDKQKIETNVGLRYANPTYDVFTTETQPDDTTLCGAALSETAVAQDWSRNEEDAVWAHLLC